jgi:uncharacterized protein (DUF2384 family)
LDQFPWYFYAAGHLHNGAAVPLVIVPLNIAAATGAAPSTARAWVALKRIPSGTRAQRIAELSSISERLLRVMDPEYIPVWMNKPVPALDDRKPIELISRGEYLRVARIVSALEEPVAT